MTYAPPEPKKTRTNSSTPAVKPSPRRHSSAKMQPLSPSHPLELEADRLAADSGSKHALFSISAPEAALPTSPLIPGGQPLHGPALASLSRDIGTELPRVFLHDDAAAHALTSSLNAHALTVGHHIILGDSAPQDKNALLRHEAIHVLQREGRTPASRENRPSQGQVMAKRDPRPRGEAGSPLGDLWDALDRLLARDWSGAKAILDSTLEKAKDYTPLYGQDDELLTAAIALGRNETSYVQKILLELKANSRASWKSTEQTGATKEQIRQWDDARRVVGDPSTLAKNISTTGDNFGQMITLVEFLLEDTDRHVKWGQLAPDVKTSTNTALSPKQLLTQYLKTHPLILQALSDNSTNILKVMDQLYISLETSFKTVFTRTNGAPNTKLVRLGKKLDELMKLNNYKFFSLDSYAYEKLGAQQRKATKTDKLDDHSAVHKDYFDPDSGPTVGVDFYGEANVSDPLPEKLLRYDQLLEAREKQLALMDRLHGSRSVSGTNTNTGDDQTDGELSDDEIIARAGTGILKPGKDLHSETDWRLFMLKVYHGLLKNGSDRERALRKVVSLLGDYLKAFAMKSPFNILDKPSSYLDMNFPRAMTGQLIHDCGVFALKSAYILSLLASELPGFKLEFVVLPAHVSLVMRAKDMPLFVFNNDEVETYELSDWEDMVTKSMGLGSTQDEAEDMMVGTLAAHSFISSVSMPYRRIALDPSGNPKPKMTKALAERGDIFASMDPRSQAEMIQYLAVSSRDNKMLKEVHTKTVNSRLRPLWQDTKEQLIVQLKAMQNSAPGSVEYQAAQTQYENAVKRYGEGIDAIALIIEDSLGWRDGEKIRDKKGQTVGREREMEAFNKQIKPDTHAQGVKRSQPSLLPQTEAQPWQLDYLLKKPREHVFHLMTALQRLPGAINTINIDNFLGATPYLDIQDGPD